MYYQKKPKLKNIISNPSSLTIIGLIILILISLPLIKNVRKQISINKEINTLENEIDNLENKNTELKGLISYLNSDEFAEEQARLNLNYKKAGEEVLVIKDKNEDEMNDEKKIMESPKSIYNIEGLNNKPEIEELSNYKKWLKYFIH